MRAADGPANIIVPSERSGHESNIGLSCPHTSSESIFICLVITGVSIKRWQLAQGTLILRQAYIFVRKIDRGRIEVGVRAIDRVETVGQLSFAALLKGRDSSEILVKRL